MRSDIYYIAHIGGVLGSSRRRFSSDIFIISDSVDVVNQLAGLFDSKMSVLISPPPRQPQKLSSAEGWSNKFKSKLPNAAALGEAARTLMLLINAVVIESPPLGTVRPQFVRLPRHDEAMVQRASRSDYVRQLASSVRAQYNRMRITTTLLIVSGSVVISVIQLSATSTRSTIRIQCSIR